MIATLGQTYAVILLVSIIGVANVNASGPMAASETVQVGDPATSANFTA